MQSSRLMMLDILGETIIGNNSTPYIDYIEIQWNRRWNEPGDFTVYMPFDSEVYSQAVLVKLEGRPEVGIIQKREVTVGTEGTFVTYSGMFAEGILKWGTHLTQLSISASNWPTQLAKMIAETLTSYSNANRSHISGLREEGLTRATGQSVDFFFPILMHCEVGPIQSQSAGSHSFTTTIFTGDGDVCDWIYSVKPSTCSLRAHVFTKADYDNPDIPSNLLPGGRGEFTKANLADIDPKNVNPTYPTKTPAIVVGWEIIDANTDSGLILDNHNTYEMQMSLDESVQCPLSRGYFDDALVWWNNQYPVDRYSSFPGDEGTMYRAEVWSYDSNRISSLNAGRYNGEWGLGNCLPNCATPGDVTCEMVAGNRATIASEILNSAKLGGLNYRKEEQISVKPEEIPGECEYMTDYDIGTVVWLSLDAPPRAGESTTYHIADFPSAQIVEVNEVHTENHLDISIVVESVRIDS